MDLNYKHYSSEEFAEDKDFWAWVLAEDSTQDAFWKRFVKENPEKAQEIEQAKKVVLQLNADKHRLDDKNVNALWEKIQNSKEDLATADSAEFFIETEKDKLLKYSGKP